MTCSVPVSPCGLGREDPELAHRALQLEGDLLGDHRVTFVSGCLLRVVAGKFGQVHLDLLPAAHREPVFGVQLVNENSLSRASVVFGVSCPCVPPGVDMASSLATT